MLCSYQRPEPWQPSVQWPMPANVPPPAQCPFVYENAESASQVPGTSEKMKAYLGGYVEVSTSEASQYAILTMNSGAEGELLDHKTSWYALAQ